MANVNTGSAAPLDMLNLQLANLQYGNVPIYDAGMVRVDNGGGRYVDFRGSFTYPGGGAGGTDPYGYSYSYDGYAVGGMGDVDPNAYYPSAGTITQITEVAGGAGTMDVTGLSLDAPTLFNMLQARNIDGVLNAVFGASDVINGSPGADWLDSYGGDDSIMAGGGNDAVRALDGNDSVDGQGGDDDVNGNRGEDNVRGGDGADWVRGGQGNDLVFGGFGDDLHVNGNIGEDVVHGDAGNDQVFGGQGADQVFGDDGNDTVSGDLGADVLTGGAGADRFLFRAGGGADVVTDFNGAEGDRVQLSTGQAFTLTTINGSAVVDLGGGDTLTLSGVSQAGLGDYLVFG
jgi:Ca2+-binding RTX toxin-like protein